MCVSSSINKHLHANTLTSEIESKTKTYQSSLFATL